MSNRSVLLSNMDALSEVFRSIHPEGTTCYRLELSAPWAVQMNAFDGAVFLVVVRGSSWLQIEGIDTAMPLVGGDLVVLSKGQQHTLRDSLSENGAVKQFDELTQGSLEDASMSLQAGGNGLPTTAMYGRFTFEPLPENPLLSALPPLLVIKGEEGRAVEWLDTTLQFMASEMVVTRPGAQVVINHLAGIVLVQAVRAYIQNQECHDRCWLRALTDPQIGEAIHLIHQHPEQLWTTEELAERVGISRTTFFTRFRELVGEPPNKYLTRWRMQRASQILRSQRLPLSTVASSVGYESEASFSKAFKQWMGQSPGAYRQANAVVNR